MPSHRRLSTAQHLAYNLLQRMESSSTSNLPCSLLFPIYRCHDLQWYRQKVIDNCARYSFWSFFKLLTNPAETIQHQMRETVPDAIFSEYRIQLPRIFCRWTLFTQTVRICFWVNNAKHILCTNMYITGRCAHRVCDCLPQECSCKFEIAQVSHCNLLDQ